MSYTSAEALQNLAHKIRIASVESTSHVKSGHPTTCSSCCEILAVLFFRVMRYKPCAPQEPCNDRFVLSKGHAAPALYSCWAEVGVVPKDSLKELRHIDSDLEGHPTPRLCFVDVGTGSLGQGLSIANGMAYVGKFVDNACYRVYCLIGDGECAEGSIWESINFASHYKLDNLVLIIDVNRMGQTGSTMYGHDLKQYEKRISACNFNCVCVDGHNIEELLNAFNCALCCKGKPTCIIAKTFKGKYFPGIEDQENWHGKPLGDKTQEVICYLKSLLKNEGKADFHIPSPCDVVELVNTANNQLKSPPDYKKDEKVATRTAYGKALVKLIGCNSRLLVFDADMRNSTYSEYVLKEKKDNFVECYIAEQNMIGVAIGAACRDRVCAFASTFAAFLPRAYDQIRMGAVSRSNINICGSHCGTSIGHDGPSQMGLEDIAMFRAVPNCTVFYPSDAIATERAVELAANTKGICYIRTTRSPTIIIHNNNQEFHIGKAVVIKCSQNDKILIIAAAITLQEALAASKELECGGIHARLLDPFTIKPIDKEGIIKHAKEVGGKILVVEDHYAEGGIGEAVLSAVADQKNVVVHLAAVRELPKSGETSAVLHYHKIDAKSIIDQVRKFVDGSTPTEGGVSGAGGEGRPVDPAILAKLEEGFKKLRDSDSKSLLKKYLTQELFDKLKTKTTPTFGSSLLDVIQSGLENHDSGVGIYAPDAEAYTVFAELFDPIIEDYHAGFKKTDKHPPKNWGDLDSFTDLDPKGEFVVSTRVRCGRSLQGYPFNPCLTEQQYKEIEQKVSQTLSEFSGELKGTFYPLTGMSKEVQQKLIDDHFLFKEGDRFLQSANACRFWPTGRGIFHNEAKTFLVWCNEEDHLRLISMQMGGDLGTIYKRLVTAVNDIEKRLPFSSNDRLGFLTFCPSNLGTTVRASVHIKVPKLAADMSKLNEVAAKYMLQVRGTAGEHTESVGGVYDISNKRRMGLTEFEAVKEMYNGIQEIIKLEREAGGGGGVAAGGAAGGTGPKKCQCEKALGLKKGASRSGRPVDPAVLAKLEAGYKKLQQSDSKSLLKKYLSQEMFDKLKTKTTPTFGSSLLDVIQSGLENHDSGIGIYAPDAEAYTVFSELFDPIIEDYHSGFKKTDKHPPKDWGDINAFDDLDPQGKFVVSTRVRCGRSLEGYPFNPCLTEQQYKEMEQKVSSTLSGLTGELKGTFYPLTGMSKEVQQKLIDDHFLFKEGDRFLQAANACRFWPTGRGIYHNDAKTFLVWCNEEDHLRLISMQMGGDLGAVYRRLVNGVNSIEKMLPFSHNDRFGFLTFCPTNLGTTVRASVHIKVPKLSANMDKLEAVAAKYKLQVRGTSGEHTESIGGIYDISNKRRMGLTEFEAVKEMHEGIREIIKLEIEAGGGKESISADQEGVCPCAEGQTGEAARKSGGGPVDPKVLEKLETGYKKLKDSDSKSLLKKYLSQEMFDRLKTKTTPTFGSSLLDVIQSGLENHDSGVGIYAPDAESYTVFAELFDPIIEDYHAGFKKTDKHPPKDWGDVNSFDDLDPSGNLVVSTRVRCGRSLEGYPFNPCLTEQQYKEMEQKVSSTLSGLTGELKGTFYPLTGMSKEVQQKLIDDHFLFKEGDRFLQAANACRFWPTGRGIFHNDSKTFLVWCNEEDHLRLISMQMGGDLGAVYRRLVNGVNSIEKMLPFSHNERFGFLTFCPTNLGTTVRASVHIKVPKLSANMDKLEAVAAKYKLQVRGTSGEHTESIGGVYDISNKRRMGLTEFEAVKEMHEGIREIIKLEIEAGGGGGGIPATVDSKSTCPCAERRKREAAGKTGGQPVDPAVLAKLEAGYKKLKDSNSKSLLKKYLSQEMFDRLKTKTTPTFGSSLLDVIQSGLENHDSGVGIYAPDAESYTVFAELFDPIIEDYHAGFKKTDKHPPKDWGDVNSFDDLDPSGNLVVSTRVRCGRSLEGYPFNPCLTEQQYKEMEKKVSSTLSGLTGELKGTFYPLTGMSKEVQQKLIDDHFLFKEGDRFLQAANACRFWPTGRGIFHNDAKTFLVWCNEEDHLRLISMQMGGDLGAVYRRLVNGVNSIEKMLPFSHNDRFGFLTFCPTNLGTTVRASVHIKVPKLSANMDKLEAVAAKYKLQVRGTSGEHTESIGGVYDISNKRRMGLTEFDAVKEMHEGIREIIKLEIEAGGGGGGIPATVDSKSTCPCAERRKREAAGKTGGQPVDPAVLAKLEAGYKKLKDSNSKSLLKKYLSQEMFDRLKTKTTPTFGSSLLDVIQSGLENHDSGVGIYAPDAESYTVFAELFDPIIEDYHAGFKKTDKHPPKDWGDVNSFDDLDPSGNLVVSTRVRCGRSLEGYPFNPCLTEQQYKEMEKKVSSTLSGLTGELKGTFYPLTGMSKEVQQKLIDDHFLFKEGDRFLQAANACRFWPTGRGIFHNDSKTFLVWCNEEDHLRLISMQMGGDLGAVYRRLVNGVNSIEKMLPFSHNDRFGFLTFCPTNLGTTVRASVHIKVPKLSANMDKLEAVAAKYKLQVRGTSGEHTESIGGVYDISNKRRMGLTEFDAVKEMHEGIREIIKLEIEAGGGGGGIPATVDSKSTCPCAERRKREAAGKTGGQPVDPAVLVKLEAGYKKLKDSNSKSLLKKYLSQEMFDRLKTKTTPTFGSSLLDVIQSGLENHDSGVGIYAPDAESYTVFAELFDPIIEDYHAGFKKTDKHPPKDWGDVNSFDDLDPSGNLVVSTRVRCGRSLEGYPFNPCLTEQQYKEMEKKVSSTLSGLTGELKGTFYPLTGMSKEVQQKLIDDHFLFKEGDRFLQAANACRFWPTGRGIFHNDAKTFLVWCNEEDHLRLISMQMGGDLGAVYRRLVNGVNSIEKMLPFSHNDRFGFLTFCPTNLGTTVRASVHIKVPKLSANMDKLEAVAAKYKLQVRGTSGEHTESIGGVYDISNKRRMGLTEFEAVKEMHEGIREIIKLEIEAGGGGGGIPATVGGKSICTCGERQKREAAGKTGGKPVDPAVLAKLEAGYKKLKDSNSKSLLKKYLSQEMFDRLKTKTTPTFGSSLLDVIQSGLENHDSGVGIYAPDAESYTVFAELFDPIIEDYHAGFKKTDKHPPKDWGDVNSFDDLDPSGNLVVSTRVRCGRSLEGYPFNPCLTEQQYKEMEKKVSSTLSGLTGELKGTFYPLTGMSKEVQQKLIDDHFLFKEGDRFLQAANACRFWPTGRGIFHNDAKTFLVWCNEEDHLRLISMQMGGDLGAVYRRLVNGVNSIEKMLPFSHNDRFGFLTFCPTNLGTTVRASVHIKVPKLSANMDKLEAVAAKYKLQVRGTSGEHTESIGGVYDISNKRRMGLTEFEAVKEMHEGIREIIKLEIEAGGGGGGIPATVDGKPVCICVERQKREAGGKTGGKPVDPAILAKLEAGYKKLKDSQSKSLLKKYLSQDVFDKLKTKTTPTFGSSLLDVIQSGLENHDSGVGIYAPDAEAYTVFADLFDPIIEDYHAGFKKTDKHPPKSWGDVNSFGDLDPAGQFVVSTRVRCGRSLEGYPFNPCLTEAQYQEMEKKVSSTLSGLTGELKGTFYPLTGMSKNVQQKLIDDHFLFKEGDRFLQAANACRFWPTGRGIFHNDAKTFLVWCNEEDHLRLISMQMGGDLGAVYRRLVTAVNEIEKMLPFSHNDRLGFLTFCPTNLGTTVRASVHIRVPKLSENMSKLEEVAGKYKLQVRGTAGEHTESVGGVYDISNKRRMGLTEFDAVKEMYDGIQEIIKLEKQAGGGGGGAITPGGGRSPGVAKIKICTCK